MANPSIWVFEEPTKGPEDASWRLAGFYRLAVKLTDWFGGAFLIGNKDIKFQRHLASLPMGSVENFPEIDHPAPLAGPSQWHKKQKQQPTKFGTGVSM